MVYDVSDLQSSSSIAAGWRREFPAVAGAAGHRSDMKLFQPAERMAALLTKQRRIFDLPFSTLTETTNQGIGGNDHWLFKTG
jgi:hypothetical protein